MQNEVWYHSLTKGNVNDNWKTNKFTYFKGIYASVSLQDCKYL